MNENAFVEIGVRKILGEPIISTGEMITITSNTYDMDIVDSVAQHYGFELSEVTWAVAEYLNWFEVLILRSRDTGAEICAYYIISNGEWMEDTLEAIEPRLVRDLFTHCHIEIGM